MQDDTPPPSTAGSCWFGWLVEAISVLLGREEVPSRVALGRQMAAAHALDPQQIAAWLQSCDAVAELAAAPFAPADTALEEERTCVHRALRAARPILEWRLQERLNRVDEQAIVPTPATPDARYLAQGLRVRTWESVAGRLSLARRYFYCPTAKTGCAPAERIVGLPPGPSTAFFEERCTRMATQLPHGKAVTEVHALLGIAVSATTMKALVERRATAVQALQHLEASARTPYDPTGLPREVPRPTDAVAAAPDVAYLEVDGVFPMTRERIAPEPTMSLPAPLTTGPGGKGRRYTLVGREVKNAVLYDGAHCAAESPSRGCITEKRYVSHLGDWRGRPERC